MPDVAASPSQSPAAAVPVTAQQSDDGKRPMARDAVDDLLATLNQAIDNLVGALTSKLNDVLSSATGVLNDLLGLLSSSLGGVTSAAPSLAALPSLSLPPAPSMPAV
jgi:ABC-type transporter Mla subunit MlaD